MRPDILSKHIGQSNIVVPVSISAMMFVVVVVVVVVVVIAFFCGFDFLIRLSPLFLKSIVS